MVIRGVGRILKKGGGPRQDSFCPMSIMFNRNILTSPKKGWGG